MVLVQRSAISHARLMRESSDRIQSALRGDDRREHMVAHRILETPNNWRLWESEHSYLMRQVADHSALRSQAAALRNTALRLIHGKALFEYLRKNSVRGAARAQILSHFYPTRAYHYAVVIEHGAYMRKACSFMCAGHLGADVVGDPAFLDPMQHYEHLYSEYFDLYCGSLFPGTGAESSESSLLPLLKHQLNEWRAVILNPQAGLPRLKRESEIRRPTGDTQRLPTLKTRPPKGRV
jgi:hypothetical protein